MNENTIEIKLVGEPAGGSTGGGGQTRPPVGSSQDTTRLAGEDLRPNADLEAAFAEAFADAPAAGGPPASDRMRAREEAARSRPEQEREREERNRQIQEESDRRQRVQNGLAAQRQAEEREAQRAKEAEERELNAELKRQFRQQQADERKERRELDADLKRQYREQQAAEREREGQERELNADLKRQYREQQAEEKRKANEEKKAAREEKEAATDQRLRYIQAGQGAAQLANSRGAGGKVSGFMQLAGSGFLGETAEGFANSPAGGMLTAAGALVDAADGLIKGAGASAREGIQAGANVGSSIIGNDPAGALTAATEAVAGFADNIPIVGTLFAEQLRTSTAGLQAFNQVVLAAVDRARQLEQFNAGIAGANARAETRRTQDDVAEAQRNERSFANIVDAQSRIESTSRAVFDPLKDALLEVLGEFLTILADIGEDVKPAARGIAKLVAFAVKTEAGAALLPLRTLAAVIDLAFKFLGGREEPPPADLLDQVNKALDNLKSGKSERNPADEKDRPGKTNKMKTPVFFAGGK